MEIITGELAEFVHKDVTVFVRKRASMNDSYAIHAIRKAYPNDLAAQGRAMIRLFVVGWKGVTDKGAEVPYSYEMMETALPVMEAVVLVPELCKFIAANVDILADVVKV